MVDCWDHVGFDLLRMNSDWLWSVDASGRLVEWRSTGNPDKNEAGPDGFGLWQTLLRDDACLRDDRAILFRTIREGKPFRYLRTACIMPHLGVRGWLRVSGVPIRDEAGALQGYRGAALNITGAMMTSRKLKRADKHNRNLMLVLEASPMAVFLAQPKQADWYITYANAALANLSGLDGQSLMGQQALFMTGRETDAVMVEMIRERIEKRLHTTQRLRLMKKDGSAFWGELTLIPGCEDNGACTLIGLVRNVEAEVAYQAAELQRSRLHALGELAGGMAHEVNNLLQPACLNTEILADEFPPDSPLQELLRDITSGLDQIRYIVRNTLQFSRKDESDGDGVSLPISPLLEERVGYLRTLLPATVGLQVDVEPSAGEGYVRLNPTTFTQVLTNLLTNASHAMQGKGEIRVNLRKIHLDGVRQQRETLPLGNYFVLSVADTGCGMTEAVRARIFEPFFTTKKIGEGTGLGLSVVYGLVTQWGGTISVQSQPGSGSTFTLYVPEDVSQQSGTIHPINHTGVSNGNVSQGLAH